MEGGMGYGLWVMGEGDLEKTTRRNASRRELEFYSFGILDFWNSGFLVASGFFSGDGHALLYAAFGEESLLDFL